MAGILLLIVSSIFLYIHMFGINILFEDEWSFVTLIKGYRANGLSFAVLFKQHMEHRIFFPRLFYIETLPIFQMNSLAYMYCHACMLCAEFYCLYIIAKKQFSFTLANIPIWIVIIPLLIFNFRQSDTLISAFEISFYMALTFVVISLFFIEKFYATANLVWKTIFLVIALVLATIATYSAAMGMIVWIAGGTQILVRGQNNKRWLYLSIWMLIGILEIYVYNHGLNSPILDNVIYALKHPFVFADFFFSLISLSYVGNYLSKIALPLGLFIFSLSVYILFKTYRNNRLRENSFWIGIYIFSVLFALETTLGRCSSFDFVDRSRYTIFTSLISISTFMLFYDSLCASKFLKGKNIFTFLFMGIVLLSISLDAYGIVSGREHKFLMNQLKDVVLNYRTQPVKQKIKEIFPWFSDNSLNLTEESIPFLDENHYNVFIEKK